jgi:hypothetical protein
MIGKADDLIRWLLNQDRDKLFEVKQHREKRSLNANAYAWVLIGKIADAIRSSKDEVYLMMLKRYGQRTVVSVRSDINVIGYFKYYEAFASGYVGDTEFTHYYVYKGSSDYDSAEMASLIDGIISEAKELGIETLPPAEIARLKEVWRGHEAVSVQL